MRRRLIALALIVTGPLALAAPAQARPEFSARVSPLDASTRHLMVGRSWRPGCPVPMRDLRLIRMKIWGFDRRWHRGSLVVNRRYTDEMVRVFERLYEVRYPIRQMRLVDHFGADDHRSMAADNTSAFNCRYVEGTRRWSEHAYGRALDLNPIENPYVSGGHTSHRASVPYLDRSRRRPGMAYEGGAAVRAFDAIGWGWGGRWSAVKDYQHFSARGASATGHAGRQRSFWACPVGHTPVEGRFTCRRLRLVKAREGRCCTASSDHRPRGRVGGRRGSWAL